jgi:hypothetical protein
MRVNVSRQMLLLTAVGVALAVVVIYPRLGGNTPAGSSAAPSNPARATTSAAATAEPVADVKLELLKTAPSELEAPDRNLFQFKPKAPPPAPAPSQAANTPRIGVPVVVPQAPPMPQGPPPPPPIALKYIGVLETAQGRVAVFRDTGGEIVNGKEGDIIDGRYRLLKIGVESADVAYVDGRGRQTIRLSGQ